MDKMEQKYFCQQCAGARNHYLLYEKKLSGGEEDYNFYWTRRFQVIECCGCNNISFLETYGDNFMMKQNAEDEMEYYDDSTIYPPYLKQGEELKHLQDIPDNIRIIYKESINAFKAESLLLTAAGFRAIIEAICNNLKIKNANLADRIDLLHSKGHLSKSESKRLHSIRFLGNKALHEIQTPKIEQLSILLSIINHLLNNLFVNDKMMKDKLEIAIDNYEEFIGILQKLIKKDMIGTEVNLAQVLGKSTELISKKNFEAFTAKFMSEVFELKFDFLEVTDQTKSVFKINALPKLDITWEF